MPSNHLILCSPLLLPPSIFPSIRVFSNESAIRIRWPGECKSNSQGDIISHSLECVHAKSLSHVRLFATPWTAACQASLSITNSQSLLKLMSIESVIPSNHLILCQSLLLLPSIFPSIKVFSNETVLHIRWPKYWSFNFSSVLPMNIQD